MSIHHTPHTLQTVLSQCFPAMCEACPSTHSGSWYDQDLQPSSVASPSPSHLPRTPLQNPQKTKGQTREIHKESLPSFMGQRCLHRVRVKTRLVCRTLISLSHLPSQSNHLSPARGELKSSRRRNCSHINTLAFHHICGQHVSR